jgi:hypothetical protein
MLAMGLAGSELTVVTVQADRGRFVAGPPVTVAPYGCE